MITSGVKYYDVELKRNAQIINVHTVVLPEEEENIYFSVIALTEMAGSEEPDFPHTIKRKIMVVSDNEQFPDEGYQYLGTVVDQAIKPLMYSTSNHVFMQT